MFWIIFLFEWGLVCSGRSWPELIPVFFGGAYKGFAAAPPQVFKSNAILQRAESATGASICFQEELEPECDSCRDVLPREGHNPAPLSQPKKHPWGLRAPEEQSQGLSPSH